MASLRFSSRLHHVNWKDVVSKELPLATETKVSDIFHISGKYSINPLLLIAKVVIDEKNNLQYLTQGDTTFSKNLASFANSISKHDLKYVQ